MADTPSITKMVPGFDFLQGLVKNASSALPSIGQWVAPTLDPQELEKRIEELRTVQFWLEQNARMLGATIQALEVQRMTLSTLKTMNVQMEDLRDSLQIRLPEAQSPAPATAKTKAKPAAPSAAAGAIDPMQWWGALTQQFNQLAATAIKDSAAAMPAATAGGAPEAARQAPAPAAKPKPRKPAARKAAARKQAAPRS
ncbi:MAG: hypothetical protein OEY03_06020 [Rhizobacter sp.]|nr:hypothetical protein [Rhizobacter sp.]